MKALPSRRCCLATAAAMLALAGASGAATRGAMVTTTTAVDVTTTSTSSSTSSTFVSGGIGECEFDLVLPEGGSFESLELVVHGPLDNDSCRLASIPQLEGAELHGSAFHGLTVSMVSQELPAGTILLHCDSDEFIEGGQTVTVDFLDVSATGTEASGAGGEPVVVPRLCASGIECGYGGGGDLDWIGDPKCGDADYNWSIGAIDALRALRTSVGQPSCVPVPTVCDTNGDLQVTAADALLILRVSVELEAELACPIPCHP